MKSMPNFTEIVWDLEVTGRQIDKHAYKHRNHIQKTLYKKNVSKNNTLLSVRKNCMVKTESSQFINTLKLDYDLTVYDPWIKLGLFSRDLTFWN